jgi:hypothetical protein
MAVHAGSHASYSFYILARLIKTKSNLIRELDLPEKARQLSIERDFDLQGYGIDAADEQLRPKRIVRIGAIQNKIVLPTNAPVQKQVSETLMRNLKTK